MIITRGIKKLAAALPIQVRRFLRACHRDFVFWRAMRRFLRDPAASTASGNNVIADLIYGWGNEAWSALEEYSVGCLKHALASKGPILECGSGLTTIMVGVVAQKSGNTIWSLEHTQAWGERVKKYLKRYRIDSVRMCVNPLKDYGDFFWYEPPLELMPNEFSLILCDGPPGDTRGGRYGLVPIMKGRLKPGCIILLDDAARKQERAIAARWQVELRANYETLGVKKPYIRMTLIGKHDGHPVSYETAGEDIG